MPLVAIFNDVTSILILQSLDAHVPVGLRWEPELGSSISHSLTRSKLHRPLDCFGLRAAYLNGPRSILLFSGFTFSPLLFLAHIANRLGQCHYARQAIRLLRGGFFFAQAIRPLPTAHSFFWLPLQALRLTFIPPASDSNSPVLGAAESSRVGLWLLSL